MQEYWRAWFIAGLLAFSPLAGASFSGVDAAWKAVSNVSDQT